MKVQVKVNGRPGMILDVPDDIKAEDITIEVIEGLQCHEINMTWTEILDDSNLTIESDNSGK